MTHPPTLKAEKKVSDKAKDFIAKAYGFEKGVIGSRWRFAMLITHRSKRQIKMYEDVIGLMDEVIEKYQEATP